MAVVTSRCTITPAEPTFEGPFPLSEIDQCKAWSLASTIYSYPPNTNPTLSFSLSRIVQTLKVSLSRALVPFYPLAGRLRWIGGGRLELVCNAMGAEFVVAEYDSTMEEFGVIDSSDRIKPLLPIIDYDVSIEKLPVMSVRVTGFACGGVAVGLAISHMLVDGASAMQFIRTWTKLARGEALEAECDEPFHDRRLLVNKSPSPPSQLDIPTPWKPLPFIKGRSDANEEQDKETSVAMLKLTKDQIEAIQKSANTNYEVEDKEPKRPYTRFESITAHIWRTACKARALEPDQPTVCVMVGDLRRRATSPPIPDQYFGNTVLITTTDPKSVSGELVSKTLSFAASKVREAVRSVNGSLMSEAIGFIGHLKDLNWTRTGFHVAGSKKGMFLGNPNIRVTSWIGLPIHDADFGWGKPSYMGPGAVSCDGRSYIIPSCDEDGALVVALRFQTHSIALFRKIFYQDIDD